MIEIVPGPIDVAAVIESVASPSSGAVSLFIGTTRNANEGRRVTGLRYEAYIPLAVKEMERIAGEVRSRWPVERVSLVHRIGEVPVGEASVVIAVSTPHRKESFEACRYAIDELKKRVPIWKQEVFDDGTSWVEEPWRGAEKGKAEERA